MTTPVGRLEPKTPLIKDLIAVINEGEIKIPKFQRRFVWKAAQALKLLDSIAHFYPMGSILLWRTRTKIVPARNIGNFNFPETDPQIPTDYVLDGQQRITVIWSSLGAPVGHPSFAAGYNLRTRKFEEIKNPQQYSMFPSPYIFPLRLLFNQPEYSNFWQSLQSQPDASTLQGNLSSLLSVFYSYTIPIVTLVNLGIDEVCPIFERINSTGTQLSMYDLMVATTWSETFDLDSEFKETALKLKPKGFKDIKGDTFVKCISAVNSNSSSRGEILKLKDLRNEQNQLVVLASKTSKAMLRAVDLLATEFKIHSSTFLPYEALLVILCSVLSNTKALDRDQIKRIREWFWRASFTERYRGAADTYISADIVTVLEYVLEADGSPETFGEIPTAFALRSIEFEPRSSRSRAFILALATRNPQNITNGASIDTSIALSNINNKEYHHIYPKAHLKRVGTTEKYDLLANICMLAASENKKISDKDPNHYLPIFVDKLGDGASSVFKSNLLPIPGEVDYTTLDYTTFLNERAKILHEAVKLLCEGRRL